MPRRRRKSEEDTIFAAIDSFEAEVSSWRELPTNGYGREPHLRLVRYPRLSIMDAIGPAEVTAESVETIEHVDLPKKEIPFFLRYRGMQAALKAVKELE